MPTEKISFQAFENYETFSFKTIEDQELFDLYYDTIIEPKIISFLAENGYPINTDTDEDYEDENIEYDDVLILQQSSVKIETQILVNQLDKSIKQEIDDSSSDNEDKRKKNYCILNTKLIMSMGEKEHPCTECQNTFSQNPGLKTHLRSHKNIKPISCEECNKMFSACGCLKNHNEVLSNGNPYTCSKCQNTFSQNGCLKNHLNKHSHESKSSRDECAMYANKKCHWNKPFENFFSRNVYCFGYLLISIRNLALKKLIGKEENKIFEVF